MNVLVRLFGYPHELLHAFALWTIGRRALSITQRYIDIPDDLTTGQYLYVAGLPALVFWGVAAFGVLGLLNAHTLPQAAMGLAGAFVGGLAGVGTLGDIHLIVTRLLDEREH